MPPSPPISSTISSAVTTRRAKVYGDSAYGTGEFQQHLDDADIASGCRTQPPSAPGGLFTKDRFDVDLDADTVTCPQRRHRVDPPRR